MPSSSPADLPRPLPQPSTPFVGRERELADLVELLEDSHHRLVTVMGGGGVGKSRLALEVARLVRTSFPDGVAFVRVGSLDDAAQLPPATLSALGIDPAGPGDPVDRLLEAVRDREVLLIFDSPEHLLSAVRDLVTLILDLDLKAAILVTSLERLGLQAEWCFEVEGLGLGSALAPAAMREVESIQLFIERGRRIQRRLGTDNDELADIHRICRLVEGIPLAIELAASAVDRQICRQIADDLETDIGRLASGHYDLPDRHRSLAAVLDFSWGRLSELHQRFLRRLSVFRGGWEAEAASQIAEVTHEDLRALSDRSMIRQDRSGRFSFHALMQQHAAAMLREADEAQAVQQAHLAYYVELAEKAEPELLGLQQIEWLPRLDQELANFRQALAWGMEQGETESVARLCLALARFWMIRGYLAEGQETIERLLALRAPEARLIRLHNRAGILAAMQRRFDQAAAHLRASVDLARQAGDTQGEVMSLNSLGAMSIERGEYEHARIYLEACLPIWEATGDANGLASTLNNLGAVSLLMEDYPTARTRFEQCLPLFRQLGDRRMIAGVLYNFGDLSLKQGEPSPAWTFLRESLELRHQIGEAGGVAETLEGIARAAIAEGRAAEAAKLLGAAAGIRELVGAPLAPVNEGDYEDAVVAAIRLLGDEAFRVCYDSGRGLGVDEAVALALRP